MKDWTGNSKSIYAPLGASNHSDSPRQEDDFYATDPIAAELLLKEESFSPQIWECACGTGHLADVFKKHGYQVRASDLIDRGYGEVQDFLGMDVQVWDGDIITNPPYKFATEFIYKALSIIPDGHKVAMFLKVQFLEGKERRTLFDSTPPIWYISRQAVLNARRTATLALSRLLQSLTLGSCGRRAIVAIQ